MGEVYKARDVRLDALRVALKSRRAEVDWQKQLAIHSAWWRVPSALRYWQRAGSRCEYCRLAQVKIPVSTGSVLRFLDSRGER